MTNANEKKQNTNTRNIKSRIFQEGRLSQTERRSNIGHSRSRGWLVGGPALKTQYLFVALFLVSVNCVFFPKNIFTRIYVPWLVGVPPSKRNYPAIFACRTIPSFCKLCFVFVFFCKKYLLVCVFVIFNFHYIGQSFWAGCT